MPQQKIASNELEFSSGVFPITGAVSVSAGSNTAPGFTTAGDTNTGIFFPAADTIAFSDGGVESMRIDASGNIGIGTTSPSQKLHVVGKGIFNNGTSSNDSLSVGTTSSSSGTNFGAIDINGLQYSGLYLRTENVNRFSIFQVGTFTAINTLTAIPLTFGTNDTERMRIDSAGRVTAPFQPAFFGYASATTNADIVYGNTYVNIGSHLNTSTGIFTAPVAGTYFFTAHGLANGGSADLYLKINNVTRVAARGNQTTASISGMFTLAAGDTARVSAGNQIYGDSAGWSAFSGRLVQ